MGLRIRLNEAIRSGGASGVASKTSIVRKRRWTRNVRCVSAEILQQIRSNTYTCTYIHTYTIHSYYIQQCTYIHMVTYDCPIHIHTCAHTNLHTYIHIHIHTHTNYSAGRTEKIIKMRSYIEQSLKDKERVILALRVYEANRSRYVTHTYIHHSLTHCRGNLPH